MGVLGGFPVGEGRLAEGMPDTAVLVGLSVSPTVSAHGRGVLDALSLAATVGTLGITQQVAFDGLSVAPSVGDTALACGIGLSIAATVGGGPALLNPGGAQVASTVGALEITPLVGMTGLSVASSLASLPVALLDDVQTAPTVGGGPALVDLIGLEIAAEVA